VNAHVAFFGIEAELYGCWAKMTAKYAPQAIGRAVRATNAVTREMFREIAKKFRGISQRAEMSRVCPGLASSIFALLQ
jgi:hypothetical protein